jgi:hypothetical protein
MSSSDGDVEEPRTSKIEYLVWIRRPRRPLSDYQRRCMAIVKCPDCPREISDRVAASLGAATQSRSARVRQGPERRSGKRTLIQSRE